MVISYLTESELLSSHLTFVQHASHVTMSVSKLLSRIVAPQLNKEELSAAKQHEQLLLHDHTYGITSDPLTQFSVVLSALIHDGKCPEAS